MRNIVTRYNINCGKIRLSMDIPRVVMDNTKDFAIDGAPVSVTIFLETRYEMSRMVVTDISETSKNLEW